MAKRVIQLRLTVSEAVHLYADKVKYRGDESRFGYCLRDSPPSQAACYDLHQAFKYEAVPLYARHAGTDDPWNRVEGHYYQNNLSLRQHSLNDGDFGIVPRGFFGIVPTDFSVLRQELMQLIKYPGHVIEPWMRGRWL